VIKQLTFVEIQDSVKSLLRPSWTMALFHDFPGLQVLALKKVPRICVIRHLAQDSKTKITCSDGNRKKSFFRQSCQTVEFAIRLCCCVVYQCSDVWIKTGQSVVRSVCLLLLQGRVLTLITWSCMHDTVLSASLGLNQSYDGLTG